MPKLLFAVLPSIFCFFSLVSFAALAQHPFDDLSADEVKTAIGVIRASGKFSNDIRFPVVKRQEPLKADWVSGKAKDQRLAYLAIFDFAKSLMTEVIVDLKNKKIASTKDLPGLTPPVLLEELERARSLIKVDKRWLDAVKKRGEKPEDAFVDIWAPGLMSAAEQKPGQRILRGVTYMKKAARNFYSRPIEGFIVNVDLSKNKVLDMWDLEKVPVASGFGELDAQSNGPIDPRLKPLLIKQPEGSSIKIDGQEVTWGRWKLRYSMDPMQGLQLFHIRFREDGEDKMILYKISLADMLVPYGGSGKAWSFRNAFDVGEYGLGKTLHPLELGKDVPDNAIMLDSIVPDDLGNEPVKIKGAAAYERDAGILWKHRNSENGDTDIRRSRQMVLTFMTTVGNYDYGTNYIFGQDGSIQVDVQLTGILLARGSAFEKNPCDGGCLPLVEKNILAPPHQHFFNFRMDFDVDGDKNSVSEMNVSAEPKGKANPDGNIFGAHNTVLKRERLAVRDHQPQSARMWKVYNASSKNALAHPRGYGIMPGEVAMSYLDPSSQIRKRAAFINHPIWFSVYKDSEMSAASPYPTTAPPGEGLPKYVANNESLESSDVVMWYTFGVTHIPRPEEWPVMNVHHTGFSLVPINFFGRNPAMSLPE